MRLKLEAGSTITCKHFFDSIKDSYNLRTIPSLNTLISSSRYWGNCTIGRLFCNLFQFTIYSVAVYDNVQLSRWYGTALVDLESSQPQPIINKGFLYCIENIHFQVLDPI